MTSPRLEDDMLGEMWTLQAAQQKDLGLDPRHMSDVERRRTTSDLVTLLHEETSDIGRLSGAHKRHLLSTPDMDKHNVGDAIADVLKVTLALAQLHNLDCGDVFEAFKRKTRVVRSKAEGERMRLTHNTKLLCVDMDDVIADLSGWGETLLKARGTAAHGKHTWDMLEAYKSEFYSDGRFRELPPVEGAPEALRLLKHHGFTIVIVTARPQWQYKRLYADTLDWLEREQVPHDHILFGKDKVELVHEHLSPAWPTAFIDDHELNAKSLAKAGIKVMLFDRPHNQGVSIDSDFVRRVTTWTEIVQILTGEVP